MKAPRWLVVMCALAGVGACSPTADQKEHAASVPPEVFSLSDEAGYRHYFEAGWIPEILEPDIEVIRAIRYHSASGLTFEQASSIEIRVTDEQLAKLQSRVPPIDMTRFPGLREKPWWQRMFEPAQSNFVRSELLSETALLSGEVCERGVFWRVVIRANKTGYMSSSVYQPGQCPEDERFS